MSVRGRITFRDVPTDTVPLLASSSTDDDGSDDCHNDQLVPTIASHMGFELLRGTDDRCRPILVAGQQTRVRDDDLSPARSDVDDRDDTGERSNVHEYVATTPQQVVQVSTVMGDDEVNGNHRDDPLYEPLLDTANEFERFILYPIRHKDIFAVYKNHLAQFWTAEEINFKTDAEDWHKLADHERAFFRTILAFFVPSDGIVNENLISRFSNEVGYTEARFFYSMQATIENIHAEVYSLIVQSIIPDIGEQEKVFREFITVPAIRAKVDWESKWLRDDGPFAERLVAFAAVEGLFFSGSFAAIFWLKKRGLMKGVTYSNELISRDEGMHRDFACLLYTKHLRNKLPVKRVYEIVSEAVLVELEFFHYAFGGHSVGEMNPVSMLQYIQFCADHLLESLNVPRLYDAKNPFDFMHLISLDGRTNFFERRVGEYRQFCHVNTDERLTAERRHLPESVFHDDDGF